jgi:putative tryptophan/tyrosine transport system substrate-binding protein
VAACGTRAAVSDACDRVLSFGTFENSHDYVAAFHQGLADGGFAGGRNVGIEYRWSEDHNDRLPALAADLVGREVAVVVAASTPASLAAKAATQSIPIVFAVGTDPVGVGLVAMEPLATSS